MLYIDRWEMMMMIEKNDFSEDNNGHDTDDDD